MRSEPVVVVDCSGSPTLAWNFGKESRLFVGVRSAYGREVFRPARVDHTNLDRRPAADRGTPSPRSQPIWLGYWPVVGMEYEAVRRHSRKGRIGGHGAREGGRA